MADRIFKLAYLFFVVAELNATRGYMQSSASLHVQYFYLIVSILNVNLAYIVCRYDKIIFRRLAAISIVIAVIYPLCLAIPALAFGILHNISILMFVYSILSIILAALLFFSKKKSTSTDTANIRFYDYALMLYLTITIVMYSKSGGNQVLSNDMMDTYYICIYIMIFSFYFMLFSKKLLVVPAILIMLWSALYVFPYICLFGFSTELSFQFIAIVHIVYIVLMGREMIRNIKRKKHNTSMIL